MKADRVAELDFCARAYDLLKLFDVSCSPKTVYVGIPGLSTFFNRIKLRSSLMELTVVVGGCLDRDQALSFAYLSLHLLGRKLLHRREY